MRLNLSSPKIITGTLSQAQNWSQADWPTPQETGWGATSIKDVSVPHSWPSSPLPLLFDPGTVLQGDQIRRRINMLGVTNSTR